MGKERNNKKNKKNRAKPAGVKSDNVETTEVDAGEVEANSSSSLQQMAASTSSMTRSSACSTYGMLFEGMRNRAGSKKKNKGDRSALKKMVDQGAPALICRLLCTDPDFTVRAQAAGSLRSMIGALEALTPSMVDQLSQAGIASSLITSIQQSLEGVKTAVDSVSRGVPTASKQLVVQTNILERSISASVALLMASASSITPFMDASIDNRLLELIESACVVDVIDLEGMVSVIRRAAQMLQKCLETNLTMAIKLTQPANGGANGRDRLALLVGQLSSKETSDGDEKLKLASIHLAGCIVNIHRVLIENGKENEDATAHTLQAILPCLVPMLNVSALPVMPPPEVRPEAPAEEGFVPTLSSQEEEAQTLWSSTSARYIITLEVFNDLLSTFDSGDEDEGDLEEWDSDDEAGMDALAASQSNNVDAPDALKQNCLRRCLACFEEVNFPSDLLGFLEQLLSVVSSRQLRVTDHLALVSDLCDVRNHVCLVLARIHSVERTISRGENWQRLVSITHSAFEEVSSIGDDVAAQWLPALGNFLFAYIESDPAYFSSGDNPQAVLEFLQHLLIQKNSEVQVHAVRCVGILCGRWLADKQLCQKFGSGGVTVLLSSLESGNPLVVSQCLDTLMDIFSEDDDWLHQIYLACSTHAKVKEAHTALKAKIRAGGGEGLDRDAIAHIKEVLLNTSRFIKYKVAFGV